MSNSFKLLFHLLKPKQYKEGPQPIYLRITVNGLRAEYSVQRECDPDLWIQKAGRMVGTKESVKILNAYLDGLVTKVYAFQNELVQNGITVSAEVLKNKLSGKTDKSRSLISIFKQHNKDLGQLVGKEYSPSTLTRYETSMNHVIEFMQWKFGISDIDINKLNHEFITDFNFYLLTVKNCNNNSAVKYTKNFRKIIRICLSNGWLGRDPFINFKVKVKEVERTFLSESELQSLHDKEFQMERLNQVKDIFLFSCYTGLAYIDAKNLTPGNIVIGIDGNKWIHTHRKKTDTPSHIPLLPPALEIIEKYKHNPKSINDTSQNLQKLGDAIVPIRLIHKLGPTTSELAHRHID